MRFCIKLLFIFRSIIPIALYAIVVSWRRRAFRNIDSKLPALQHFLKDTLSKTPKQMYLRTKAESGMCKKVASLYLETPLNGIYNDHKMGHCLKSISFHFHGSFLLPISKQERS